MTPTETNYQGKQRLHLVGNASAESEKKTIKIKVELKPEIGGHHPSKFMVILRGNQSIKMAGLVSSFKSRYKNSML